jgi:hypothetical protein
VLDHGTRRRESGTGGWADLNVTFVSCDMDHVADGQWSGLQDERLNRSGHEWSVSESGRVNKRPEEQGG